MSQTEFPNSPLPDKETIIKWIDSGAAKDFLSKPIFDGKCFNWQKFTTGAASNDIPLYVYLINAYMNYQKEGGSRKQKKDNPKNCFKNAKISAIFLDDLENDKFFFVSPTCYEDALWMDSFDCCGVGARWCIGYEQTDDYWNSYVHDRRSLFILAVNKENYKKSRIESQYQDDVKYMIQIDPEDLWECLAWLQSDEISETIEITKFKRVFGHKASEMLRVFANNILIYDNIYHAYSADIFYDNEENEVIIPWDEGYEIDKTFYIDEFYNGDYDIYNKQIDQENGLSFGSMAKQAVYDKGHYRIVIECDNEKVHPNKMHIDSQQFKKDIFDISSFCNWLKECGVTNAVYITIKNGKFNKVIWEPEASDNITDIYFENCEIEYLTYLDFSDGKDTLSFDDDCRIDTLYWAYTFDLMNTDSLDCSSNTIEHEKFYDEEMDEV